MANLRDKTYDILKEKLIDAKPGLFLSVRKCADELNMSYTPVREALLHLVSDGILELIPNIGFFVVNMNMRDIMSVFQSRICVERYVLPLVAPLLDENDIKCLRDNIERQSVALNSGCFKEYALMDISFHCFLVDKLDNKDISEFYKVIRERYLLCSKNITQAHDNYAVEEHGRFVDEVEADNYDAAAELFLNHTQNAYERILAGYEII